MPKRRLIYTAIKRRFLKIFLTFTCGIKDALYLLEYWPKTYIKVCSTLVPGPFPFPRHGKGPRNGVDSVLFRSATSQAIYLFCLLSNAFPDFGSVGLSVGKEKKPKKNGEEVSK